MAKSKLKLDDVAEYLENEEDMAAYLQAAFEDGDAALIVNALGNIARARGMAQIARDTGLRRESLYKAGLPREIRSLPRFLRWFKALGIELHAEPSHAVRRFRGRNRRPSPADLGLGQAAPRRLPFFDHPRQPHDLRADAFEVGIQPQSTAEGFQGGDRVLQFEIRLAHAGRGDEVVGIDFEGFVAIADGVGEAAQGRERRGTLIPGLGEPGGALRQLRRAADNFLVLLCGVEPSDDGDLLPVLLAAHPAPERADAVLGQRADGAVVVQQRAAQDVVRLVIAEEAERQHRGAADLAQPVQGQPLQRSLGVIVRDLVDEGHGVLVVQVAFVEVENPRCPQRFSWGAHGPTLPQTRSCLSRRTSQSGVNKVNFLGQPAALKRQFRL